MHNPSSQGQGRSPYSHFPGPPDDGTGGRGRGPLMSQLHPFSRRCCPLWLAAVACVLLALPGMSHSQPPNKQQQIAELEQQLADLQKKLEDLKRGDAAVKAPRPIAMADI